MWISAASLPAAHEGRDCSPACLVNVPVPEGFLISATKRHLFFEPCNPPRSGAFVSITRSYRSANRNRERSAECISLRWRRIDGTLAHDGIVSGKTIGALERFKKSGRKLVLVTGRELPDLKRVFPDIGLFDKVVAENGALIYTPASEEERVISPSPEPKFVARLKKQGVKPLSVGRSIVATWEPHQATVLEAIKKLGLELEIIFNKGAVMILPSGINKATGLAAALQDLRLSPHNVVGVGDAENDHAFLQACGYSVAVDNAIPAVKNTADLTTRGARGKGVEELIDRLIKRFDLDDLTRWDNPLFGASLTIDLADDWNE